MPSEDEKPAEARLPSSLSESIALGELMESKLAHEIALIGHRMEWLVVSEAFLFGAFATILTSNNPSLSYVPKMTMLFLFPALGMILAALVSISLHAALAVSKKVGIARGIVEDHIKRLTGLQEMPNLGNETREESLQWTRFWGSATAVIVPPLLFLAWAIVLIFVVLEPRG